MRARVEKVDVLGWNKSTIEQNVRFAIPLPLAPSGTNDELEKMILTKKVNAYVTQQMSVS